MVTGLDQSDELIMRDSDVRSIYLLKTDVQLEYVNHSVVEQGAVIHHESIDR